jgi:hypothetical protein
MIQKLLFQSVLLSLIKGDLFLNNVRFPIRKFSRFFLKKNSAKFSPDKELSSATKMTAREIYDQNLKRVKCLEDISDGGKYLVCEGEKVIINIRIHYTTL